MRNQTRRLLLVAIPAGAITFGLFSVMQSVIKTDDFTPTALPTYDLTAYVEAKVIKDPLPPTPKPPRPKPIDPPPQSPKPAG